MARTRRREGTAPPPPGGSTLAGASPRRLRENLPRPATATSATPGPGAAARPAAPPRRRNPFGFLGRFQPRFVGDVISELRKVTWPTFTETRYLTFVVAIVAIAVGIVLGTVDLFFGWAVDKLFF